MAAPRRFRIGDLVEVRPIDEILYTLDGRDCVDGLPFMPEMVQHCGRRFQVVRSAHKSCDFTGATKLHQMHNVVHLDMRCTGRSHGNCEARCLLFWKSAWLKAADGPGDNDRRSLRRDQKIAIRKLDSNARRSDENGARFRCQATEVLRASVPVFPGKPTHYVEDISTGNASAALFLWTVLRVFAARVAARVSRRGIRRPTADSGQVAAANEQRGLSFASGYLVRIRTAAEILAARPPGDGPMPTVEEEMVRHCGRTYRVLGTVKRAIDREPAGSPN